MIPLKVSYAILYYLEEVGGDRLNALHQVKTTAVESNGCLQYPMLVFGQVIPKAKGFLKLELATSFKIISEYSAINIKIHNT